MELLEDRRFYTYLYLDPRKPGLFRYGTHKFRYEPFYVGKGKDGRMQCHLSAAKYNPTSGAFMTRKIRKIIRGGREPIIWKFKEFLTEVEALTIEREMIMIVGLKYIGGPLCNQSVGYNPNYVRATERRISKEISRELQIKRVLNMKIEPEEWEWNPLSIDSWGEPFIELQKKELREGIGKVLSQLDIKERLVILLYYFRELNLFEIGKRLKLSSERVGQIRLKALGRLRNPKRVKLLKGIM